MDWRASPIEVGPVSRAASAGLLLLRLGFFAALATTHGVANARDLAAGVDFPDPIGLGSAASHALVTFAELVCGALVAIGLVTRPAAAVVAFNFAVAFFVVHADDSFARGELAFDYRVAAAGLALAGPGEWSVDGWLDASRRRVVLEAGGS